MNMKFLGHHILRILSCALLLSNIPLVIHADDTPSKKKDIPISLMYTKGHTFAIPKSQWAGQIDLEGFGVSNDGHPPATRLLTAGNIDRKIVVKLDYDTLYEDVEKNATAYRALWRDFHDSDTLKDFCCRRVWEDSSGSWFVRTLVSTHGYEVNEKQFHLFRTYDNLQFHLWASRPMYLEGDSVLMLDVLRSFHIIPAAAKSAATADSTHVTIKKKK